LSIGDDCALLAPRRGEELAVTTDLSIAGQHFRLNWHQPETVGHRVLARGLSDLAAMGARPVAAFLSLGLPRGAHCALKPPAGSRAGSSSWVQRFLDGLLALAEAHSTPLAGGDLAESSLAVADIVLVGAVPRGRAAAAFWRENRVTCSTSLALWAEPLLVLPAWLSWPVASPVAMIRHESPKAGRKACRAPLPQPRIAQGLWLQRRGLASAALDVSDGLSTDLAHLCEESSVAAEVDASALPIHPAQLSPKPCTAARTTNYSLPLRRRQSCPAPSPA